MIPIREDDIGDLVKWKVRTKVADSWKRRRRRRIINYLKIGIALSNAILYS